MKRASSFRTNCKLGLFILTSLMASGLNESHAATLLHIFKGKTSGGPTGKLTIDSKGALYGTTYDGGAYGLGTVFKLGPPASGTGQWKYTVLHNFNNLTGKMPADGLIFDKNGALYGTTRYGGPYDFGTIFKLTPPRSGSGPWTKTVLFYFKIDYGRPFEGLIMDASGALYGATDICIFKLAPPSPSSIAWKFQPLSSGGASSHITRASTGAIYGSVYNWGQFGAGYIFKAMPPVSGREPWNWAITHIHSFNNFNGKNPSSRIIFNSRGEIYGTTRYGGPYDAGTVYRLTPPASGQGLWTATVLHNFNNSTGKFPERSAVILDAKGALYGTTREGGRYGSGTVFKLTPPVSGLGPWRKTVLADFGSSFSDGFYPESGVILGPKGELYGTTSYLGADNMGTIFKVP